MDFLLFALSGLLGGLLGGMGMGGGTVLIPLLTIFLGLEQHLAQGINLVCFIPMAVVSLIIHVKNKLVDFKGALWIILPGVITCSMGCLIARVLSGEILTKLFGGFLVALSVFQFVSQLKGKKS